MEERKTVEAIPSAYNIISSNRSIGYSFAAAIADIIDNSISAKASEVELFSPVGRHPCLKISDNGCGMDLEELTEAMTFGGRTNCEVARDLNDLGRFGMGLKTASLSQCKRLEVISRKAGRLTGGCWDIDELRKNDRWEFLLLSEEECRAKLEGTMLGDDETMTGTTVIWTKFDRLRESAQDQSEEFDRLLSEAVDRLELIFHRFLEGDDENPPIVITYNRRRLVPNDPFLTSKTPQVSTPLAVPVKDSTVLILSHKLLHPSRLTKEELKRLCLGSTLLETQGFYVYRARRLIDYGTWFGMASKLERTKLSRIQIDIPNTLDSEWSLDIKKSRATPPQVIRQELRNVLANIGNKSAETFRPKRKKNDDATPYWTREKLPGKDAGCRYVVNSGHPLLSDFMNRLDEPLKEEFAIIISNISKYFPFQQVEFDLQNDEHLDRSGDKSVRDDMEKEIRALVGLGMSDEMILSIHPYEMEAVSALLKEIHDDK